MSHEYQLTLKINEPDIADEEIKLTGNFDDEEWELLGLFLEYAEDLISTKLVQDGMSSSLHVNIEHEKGMQVETKLPPWDDVMVFLHKFRPIGLESESTFYFKISGILTRRISHPSFRALVKQINDRYSGKRMQSGFKISSNDVVLNSDKFLYDWLNSYEYHRNQEKRQFIEALHAAFPLEISKALFIMLLAEKVRAIVRLARLIAVILGKQNSISMKAENL